MEKSTRLNKLLAEQLGISRREADESIEKGHVTINGAKAELGSRVNRGVDLVSVNGAPLATEQVQLVYVMLNKPVDYVCSRRQQGNIPTIYALLPANYHHLKTVGRLDKDSSGIILITNDGDFAHRLTHPSFKKNKLYYVTLRKPLEPLHQQMINNHGVQLEDGGSKFVVSSLTDTPELSIYPEHTYRIEMSEGRNRQIRRTFGALGYSVVGLHRTQFGNFALGNLASGSYASVTP